MIDSRQWCKTRDVLEQCLGAAAGRGERPSKSVCFVVDGFGDASPKGSRPPIFALCHSTMPT